jgi:hypothetical protein
MPDPVQINVDHASDDENVPEASTATSGVERKKRPSPSSSVMVSQAPDDRAGNRYTGSPGQSTAGDEQSRTITINTARTRERSLSATVREDGRVSPRGSRANSTANSPSGSPLPSPCLKPVVVQGGSNDGHVGDSSTGFLSPGLLRANSNSDKIVTSPTHSRRGSGSSDRAPQEFHD